MSRTCRDCKSIADIYDVIDREDGKLIVNMLCERCGYKWSIDFFDSDSIVFHEDTSYFYKEIRIYLNIMMLELLGWENVARLDANFLIGISPETNSEQKMPLYSWDQAFDPISEIASKYSDGHFTFMKFTTNFRAGFFTPSSREDIKLLSVGRCAIDAVYSAVRNLHKTMLKDKRQFLEIV